MRFTKLALSSLLFLFVVACGEGETQTPDGGVVVDAGAQPICGEGTPHQQIINAATSSQVVKKTPRHPAVGPAGLP